MTERRCYHKGRGQRYLQDVGLEIPEHAGEVLLVELAYLAFLLLVEVINVSQLLHLFRIDVFPGACTHLLAEKHAAEVTGALQQLSR